MDRGSWQATVQSHKKSDATEVTKHTHMCIYVHLYRLCCTACRVLVPQPQIERVPPAVEAQVLTSGPPGKSPYGYILMAFLLCIILLCNTLNLQSNPMRWVLLLPPL